MVGGLYIGINECKRGGEGKKEQEMGRQGQMLETGYALCCM
jgi:hypothetical protein